MPVTMLMPNKIEIAPHYTKQQLHEIATIPAKEFIMNWFRPKIAASYGSVPMVQPKTIADRVLILQSGTGSGKSMTLGPELYINFYDATKRNIAVTQPRVLTAKGLPEDIIQIPSYGKELTMGKNIGFQTGDYTQKPASGLVFMTIGVLAMQLSVMTDEEFMSKYAFIVIDECHDRSLTLDLALSLLKQLILRNAANDQCPFCILTSATMDTEQYSKYMGLGPENIMKVGGFNYHIEPHYLPEQTFNYIEKIVETALRIHKEDISSKLATVPPNSDILIFVHGSAPTKKIAELLTAANNKLAGSHFIPIVLNRESFVVASSDYQNIFKALNAIDLIIDGKSVPVTRRIIISTNIAETGVTIESLKHVIDSGYANASEFNPIFGVSYLIPKSVSQASALQRKGRVGRRSPGEWYPMYTEKSFNHMLADNLPDIYTTDASPLILNIIIKQKIENWGGEVPSLRSTTSPVLPDSQIIKSDSDISKSGKTHRHENGPSAGLLFDLLSAPSVDSYAHATNKLFKLGAIDMASMPTTIGLIMSKFVRTSMECVRMILAGYELNANIDHLITIAAFLTLRVDDYIDSRAVIAEPTTLHNKINTINDDYIATLLIWSAFIEVVGNTSNVNDIKKWCDANALKYDGLLYVVMNRDSIIENMRLNIGLDPYYNRGDDIDIYKLKQCIYEGFRLNLATLVLPTLNSNSNSNSTSTYIYNNINITVDTKLIKSDNAPTYIVFDAASLKLNKLDYYDVYTKRICIMDGILVDDTF